VAPALVRPEGVDQNLPEVTRPDRLGGGPLLLGEAARRIQDIPAGPLVVGEEEADVVDRHRRMIGLDGLREGDTNDPFAARGLIGTGASRDIG